MCIISLRGESIMQRGLKILCGIIFDVVFIGIYYYFILPPINITSFAFWFFVLVILAIVTLTIAVLTLTEKTLIFSRRKRDTMPISLTIPIILALIIIGGIIVLDIASSPLFNAASYAHRIVIDETGNFNEDIEEVDFQTLPLIDRDSSEKLGDRVMGQMNDLVSQYYVSNQYTQINYNNDILRVTPLEYADLIKWFANRKTGVKGYITVNSVSGEAKLIRLDKGMKYMPSAFFNENLYRKLRFTYPTTIFGNAKFEIDNEGKPYWIVPTYGYTAVNLKTKVTGVVILNPVTGDSHKYDIADVPTWVDNAYNPDLIIEQVDDWGNYNGGFLNSVFGQKNVVNTTSGYNYLAMNDDIYLYTGITSVLADESNLGFILSNLRTGATTFYSIAGAEEYSAMASAEGQVQQMSYESTFPLLINLNGKATYMVSLKDAAGLVKMYGFVDVADYQKVVVTDSTAGIKAAAEKYLSSYAEEISDELLAKEEITISSIKAATKDGNTYFYITGTNNKKYVASIKLGDALAFLTSGDKVTIGHYENDADIIEIVKIF